MNRLLRVSNTLLESYIIPHAECLKLNVRAIGRGSEVSIIEADGKAVFVLGIKLFIID